jgi:hypothetical protein
MSEPPPTKNRHGLSQLAAALRPVFRCPATPAAVQDLYADVRAALAGTTELDAGEATLRVVIMLRNAIAAAEGGHLRTVPAGSTIEMDDCDPDIGLYLALYSVELILDRTGWQNRPAA